MHSYWSEGDTASLFETSTGALLLIIVYVPIQDDTEGHHFPGNL